jgi:hypothetical protein
MGGSAKDRRATPWRCGGLCVVNPVPAHERRWVFAGGCLWHAAYGVGIPIIHAAASAANLESVRSSESFTSQNLRKLSDLTYKRWSSWVLGSERRISRVILTEVIGVLEDWDDRFVEISQDDPGMGVFATEGTDCRSQHDVMVSSHAINIAWAAKVVVFLCLVEARAYVEQGSRAAIWSISWHDHVFFYKGNILISRDTNCS